MIGLKDPEKIKQELYLLEKSRPILCSFQFQVLVQLNKYCMQKTIDDLATTLDNYKQYYAQFIELAAHDLQAPLRKLGVLTERLVSRYKDVELPETRQYVTRINTCLNDMRSLIDGLSELAGATPETMHYSSCNLEEIIQNVIRELEPVIREKKVVFTTTSLPVIEADARQCRQLFKNILDNAIRYSKKDEPVLVDIRSSQASAEEKLRFDLPGEKKYYVIEIADNGIGINTQDADRIFQPLVRLHGKSSFAGNGLSLAVCKRIADNHKGIIYATGAENEGACFILLLPEKP